MDGGAWWAAVHGVAKSQTGLGDFPFTSHFHALEKEMATHSSVLAWRIPGTGEPGGLLSMGSHRVGHDWSDSAAAAAAQKRRAGMERMHIFFQSVAAMKKLFSQWSFWINTITDEVWILLPYECHQTLIWTNLMNTDCFISSHFTKIFSFNLFPYYFTFKVGCLFSEVACSVNASLLLSERLANIPKKVLSIPLLHCCLVCETLFYRRSKKRNLIIYLNFLMPML